jgi:Tfp pilus assembly protein PilE
VRDTTHLAKYQYQPKERAAAAAAGEVQYFTGKPCKHGHMANRSTSSGGCIVCARVMRKKFMQKTLANDPQYWKKQYAQNPEKFKTRAINWRNKNPEKAKEVNKKSRAKSRAKLNALQVVRNASKLNATPAWLTKEQKRHIELFYEMSKRTSERSGFKCHVDHIVPLKGKNVCGLHVPWNLQVVSASYNSMKKNRLNKDCSIPAVCSGVVSVQQSALPWNWRV